MGQSIENLVSSNTTMPPAIRPKAIGFRWKVPVTLGPSRNFGQELRDTKVP